jgi:hypothetical protein
VKLPGAEHLIFIGVVSPIDPRVENPKEIRDRVLEGRDIYRRNNLEPQMTSAFHHSATYFDSSTTRETAFAFIQFQKLQIASAACRISETISAAGTSSTRNPP